MSVLLEGDTKICDEAASWEGMWQFAKDKKAGVSFNYQWISSSLPRDLLDYVSFIPSPNDPVPAVVTTCGRGRGRGRGRASNSSGRGVGRGVSRGGRPLAPQTLDGNGEVLAEEETPQSENNSDGLNIFAALVNENDKDLVDQTVGKIENDQFADVTYRTGDIDNDKRSAAESDREELDDIADITIEADQSVGAVETEADAVGETNVSSTCVDTVPTSANPVIIDRTHPLFGLWSGSFDVRGTNGSLDKVEESFFFHSFMNQDPGEDLLDLPQEPQFTSLILRRNRTDVKKTPTPFTPGLRVPLGEAASAPSSSTNSAVKDEVNTAISLSDRPLGVEWTDDGGVGSSLAGEAGTGTGTSGGPAAADGACMPEVDAEAALTSDDVGETESGCSAATTADAQDPSQPASLSLGVGEPFTKYIVGFGRNPFGRFSLTAALNEKTGRMRCEKKYIVTKGSGRRGRRPGTTFPAASRLSVDALGSEGAVPGAHESSSVRAMSTRPRKSLPDSSFFFPSSYDEAQQLMAPGPHSKKRKPSVLDDADAGAKFTKDKSGSHQKNGSGGGAAAPTTAFQQQREKDRERDRERLREKERDQELDRELDDSNSDYRVAFLDDETGEVYEGGWHPHARRRHGAGICLYSDGSLYEGGWSGGREHGKGQLMTGDRQVIYAGEWVDGTMTGHGTYTYSNGDRYTGDWREGIRHGKGEYLMTSGCSYVGDWKNNKRTGSGVFLWADGSTYDGDWENDNRHGRGLLALANGFRYDGGWFQNYMEGRGVSVFPGGQEYQGSYKAGLREGRGSIKFAHGAVYEGRFRDDRIDGQGTIVVTETMPGAEEGEILIPIQIQADIRRIHLKAGFGADAAH